MPHTNLRLLLAVLLLGAFAVGQRAPEGDVYAGFSYLSVDTNNLLDSRPHAYGWEASGSFNLTRLFAVEGEASGHYYSLEGSGISVNVHDHGFAGGPRLNFGPVFVHSLFGGDILGAESVSQTGFVLLEGGGVQVPVAKHWGVRVSADYVMSRHNVFAVFNSNLPRYDQNNFRVGAGLFYHFGARRSGDSDTTASHGRVSQPVSSSTGIRMGLREIGVSGQWNSYGLYVREVVSGSPAEKAGIAVSDTIVQINGRTIQTQHDAEAALSERGGTAEIGITKPSWASTQIAIRKVDLPSSSENR